MLKYNLNRKLINEFLKYNKHFKKHHNFKGQFFDFIFLCGKKPIDNYKNDNRYLIERIISDNLKRYKTMFAENIFKHTEDMDLLTLEELLLEISSHVIILVESYGS